MSLRAAQIAVQAPSREALREALDRALRRQKPPPRPRRIVAALADGWAALVEEGRPDVDGGLARLLSEQLDGDAIVVELDGASLSLRLRAFRAGEPRDLPQQAALQALPFADVEQLAWDALREPGVPSALRLCDPDVLKPAKAGSEGFDGLLADVPAGTAKAEPAVRDVAVALPERTEGPSPPAEPDLWVESKAGEQCALEARALKPFAPTAAAADALAAIEEAHALRLARSLAARTDDERLSRISFMYRGAPEALAPLLESARRGRPRLGRFCDPRRGAPLSAAGFTRACRAALSAALPEAAVLRAHALRLELAPATPGVTLRAPMAAAYQAYLDAADEPVDPAAALAAQVAALLAAPPVPLAALPRDAFLAGLLPSVALHADGSPRATGPLGGPLRAALLHDDGTRIAEVQAADLAAHELSFAAALARAVENVEALTLRNPAGISWFDLDEGRVVVFDFDDPAGAGRVLSAQARGALNGLLGEPCLCTVPTRDSLLACSMLEPDAIAWVEGEAKRRAAEGPHALAATLLVATRDSVAPSTVGDVAAGLQLDSIGDGEPAPDPAPDTTGDS